MRLSSRSIMSLSALFFVGFYVATAHSQGNMPPRPPQEAIQACEGKKDNDDCQFNGKNHEVISGTCHKKPDGQGELACVPAAFPTPNFGSKANL